MKNPRRSMWDFGDSPELKIHRIHAYPAKFPAFITTKAISYAKKAGVDVKTVADVFCGCGTTAFESRKAGLNFWGCDINPVATLIAKVKSSTYNLKTVKSYREKILSNSEKNNRALIIKLPKRLDYWFDKETKEHLARLLCSIRSVVKEGPYRDFFLCAFSNILKPASRWLTKSIKPQIDPHKSKSDVSILFNKQIAFMIDAVKAADLKNEPYAHIERINLLNITGHFQTADVIVTSPPYVTSYEYADLHQLSTLWLGYVNDYRDLRKGTIGSVYNATEYKADERSLARTGRSIIRKLKKVDDHKARTSLRYFIDMNKAVLKCKECLRPGGMIFFVIGDTEYKGVKVMNSEYLRECLKEAGFSDVRRTKRRITGKILTPYRNEKGCFSRPDSASRKIYAEEYVLTGRIYA